MKLKRDFFTQPTLKVAKKLLGKYIVRKYRGKLLIGKIVETEAYIGPKDKASHAYSNKEQPEKEKLKIIDQNWQRIKNYVENRERFIKRILKLKNAKVTKRNLAEYLKGGHIYIYLVYGNYYQLNITTYKEGYPECVLIRSLEPVATDLHGLNMATDLHRYKRRLLKVNIIPNGPGKLCQYLKLDSSFWGEDVYQSERIWLEDNSSLISSSDIIKTKRIGIDYAGDDANLPWRFYLKNNKWISKK
ncbi:MAG: putative 3-methyladenine DNA glycosylase [Candidatus Parcubacteria bacterium]|nr:MAG: putative 3-methyladenine DNA glycosylase [Candidatus Parcubacteria bacterium]